jgi:hypothetical protein
MTPCFAVSIYLHFPILILVISLVYSATRFEHWPDIFREARHWMIRMTLFLGGIALVLYLFSLFL